jgi:hypothetical protein
MMSGDYGKADIRDQRGSKIGEVRWQPDHSANLSTLIVTVGFWLTIGLFVLAFRLVVGFFRLCFKYPKVVLPTLAVLFGGGYLIVSAAMASQQRVAQSAIDNRRTALPAAADVGLQPSGPLRDGQWASVGNLELTVRANSGSDPCPNLGVVFEVVFRNQTGRGQPAARANVDTPGRRLTGFNDRLPTSCGLNDHQNMALPASGNPGEERVGIFRAEGGRTADVRLSSGDRVFTWALAKPS